MKKSHFFRSPFGKFLLYLACVISTTALALCFLLIFALFEGNVYSKSLDKLQKDSISNRMTYEGYSIIPEGINNDGATKKNVIRKDNTYTNLRYIILDQDGNILIHNCDVVESKQKNLKTWADTKDWPYEIVYATLGHQSISDEVNDDMPGLADQQVVDVWSQSPSDPRNETNVTYYTMKAYLLEGTPVDDYYRSTQALIALGFQLRYIVFAVTFALLLLTVYLLITAATLAGKRPGSEEYIPGLLEKIPYDLYLAIEGIAILICIVAAAEMIDNVSDTVIIIALIACCIAVSAALGIDLLIRFFAQFHCGTLLRGTICYRLWKLLVSISRSIFHWLALFFHSLPLVWRTAMVLGILSILEFLGICILYDHIELFLFVWLAEKAVFIPLILYAAILLRKLQAAGQAIAEGDLNYRADTSRLFWDLKKHADNLNSISKGISIAVEDRLKSERMKTELITNVSHDIKTPLTSIINYGGLIQEEACDNPKVQEYTEVMVRQSVRLKRLLEDLVEASKASTGNLDVELAPCDASLFLSQSGGEYEEKLERANLTLVTKGVDKEIYIMADGRRMWRIFDNLMNNACKYSLPGSRVYMNLEEVNGNAVISLKNTSREPLDISEEELMERFVRGDSSRNTEGNGLGLSIARSMAELQGGSLNIVIDGDLFKAVLTFPAIQ